MNPSQSIQCSGFPCIDVNKELYYIPDVVLDPSNIKMLMISESSPKDLADHYYATGNPLFQQTTVQAFCDAGLECSSINELTGLGVYFTTAIKCGKIDYTVKSATVKNCSYLLEKEIESFKKLRVIMLMGDFAIKSLNYISKRQTGDNVVPRGSTYKIRGKEYLYRGIRVFPSYLQAGPAFFIEKSKRRMINEDLKKGLELAEIW
jgi:uracil-DNA glycosylase